MADLDSTRTITAVFTADGSPTDTTVVVTIVAPDGTPTVLTNADLTHPSTGSYEYDLVLDQVGAWLITWEGSGAVPAEDSETIIVVDPTHDGPDSGPCETWITWEDLDCAEKDQITDGAQQQLILAFVSDVLWRLSCEQFGICSVTVRPCRVSGIWSWWSPTLYGGAGYYPSLPSGGGCRGCRARTAVELPVRPVAAVSQVKVDGVVMSPTDYRVDQWRDLVRLDGDRWPTSQNLQLADTEVGTWSVTIQYGAPVPPGGVLAAKLYGCEVVKGVLGQDCALPPGTTSASRDGVTVNIIDSAEAAASGKTGVLLVDMWLETVCPGGPGKAMSGGMDIGRRDGRAIQVGT